MIISMDDVIEAIGDDRLRGAAIQAKLKGKLAPRTICRNLFDAVRSGRICREREDRAPFEYFRGDDDGS